MAAGKLQACRMQDRPEQDRQSPAQGSLPALSRRREEFYNTRFRRAVEALPAWNGTDNRSRSYLFLWRARGASNDWRLRSRKKSSARRPGTARLLSHRFNRRLRAIAQMFSFGPVMGAIGPDGILSGGTTSGGGGIDVDVGAAGASCLIRVDINMAAKSNAAAT